MTAVEAFSGPNLAVAYSWCGIRGSSGMPGAYNENVSKATLRGFVRDRRPSFVTRRDMLFIISGNSGKTLSGMRGERYESADPHRLRRSFPHRAFPSFRRHSALMPLEPTDLLLLERIRAADAEAWEEFISRYEGRLTAFVRSRLGNATAAEDVVQDTFAGFLIGLPNYDSETPLEAFLFAIAAHKLTDVLRRQGRRPTLPLLADEADGRERELESPSRKASSMARSRERTEVEQRVLGACLQALVGQWKERGEFERLQCVELLFVLGWPNKDAAQRLGISEQTVANHKQYVVTKLKDAARAARLRDFDPSRVGIE